MRILIHQLFFLLTITFASVIYSTFIFMIVNETNIHHSADKVDIGNYGQPYGIQQRK